MSIAPGIRGSKRYSILAAHRLALYQAAYVKYLWGECDLEYLNERLNKLLEMGLKPKQVTSVLKGSNVR